MVRAFDAYELQPARLVGVSAGGAIAPPTLVIHGTADPMFPIEHGQALAEVIPNTHLVVASGAGHGLESMDTGMVLNAILKHTGDRSSRFRSDRPPHTEGGIDERT
jgi:hypothetical protein